METYMMFGQEYKKNASQVNKNFNKKNHLWIILNYEIGRASCRERV